jgi:hypothetical protein
MVSCAIYTWKEPDLGPNHQRCFESVEEIYNTVKNYTCGSISVFEELSKTTETFSHSEL